MLSQKRNSLNFFRKLLACLSMYPIIFIAVQICLWISQWEEKTEPISIFDPWLAKRIFVIVTICIPFLMIHMIWLEYQRNKK